MFPPVLLLFSTLTAIARARVCIVPPFAGPTCFGPSDTMPASAASSASQQVNYKATSIVTTLPAVYTRPPTTFSTAISPASKKSTIPNYCPSHVIYKPTLRKRQCAYNPETNEQICLPSDNTLYWCDESGKCITEEERKRQQSANGYVSSDTSTTMTVSSYAGAASSAVVSAASAVPCIVSPKSY